MIISRTPYRLSFVGGGTDYPAWYRKHGGAVLATTIDKYCYLTCRYLPPFFEHRYRIVWSKIERVKAQVEISHPVLPKALEYMGIEEGLELHHDGDLPARSGMGSSSSFVVGLLHVLNALKGKMISKEELLEQSLHLEQDLLKENVGSQDQTLAVYGGLNRISFKQTGQILVEPLTIPEERIEELNGHLMLFFSGTYRRASDIVNTYVGRLEDREQDMNSLREMVNEGVSILCEGEDIRAFGHLLHKAWMLKRSLSESISNSLCDQIYETALQAGALGGKMLGAGGGGFMLFFVPIEVREAVRKALSNLIYVPFKFESLGSQIIHYSV